MKCDKCDAQSWRVTEKLGSIEAWECDQCGNQISVHVNDPGIGDSVSKDFLHTPELKGAWLTKPSKERVQRAEALLPMLERLSPTQHLRRYVDKASFSLGRINAADHHELERELRDIGIGILDSKMHP